MRMSWKKPFLAASSGEIQSISIYTHTPGIALTLGVWIDNAGTIGELVATSETGISGTPVITPHFRK